MGWMKTTRGKKGDGEALKRIAELIVAEGKKAREAVLNR
jgi:hypothetical protein